MDELIAEQVYASNGSYESNGFESQEGHIKSFRS